MRVIGAAIAAMVVLPVAVAIAQPKKDPDQATQEKAAGLVQRGIECQSRRETGCAVGLYTQAYCLIPEPALIYNIGTAYQEGGKANDALRWFRLYLKQAPSGELAKEAKSKIAQLKPAATAGDTGAAEISCKKPTPEPKVTPPAETPVCAPGEKFDGNECVADVGTIQPPPPPEGKKPRPIMLYAGIGTATLGAVGLGVGLAYGVKAKNASDALSDNTGPWTAELLAKQDEGESAERKQIMFTIVGGVALVGGAALVIIGLRKNRPTSERAVGVQLVPVVTPDAAGFALGGRY